MFRQVSYPARISKPLFSKLCRVFLKDFQPRVLGSRIEWFIHSALDYGHQGLCSDSIYGVLVIILPFVLQIERSQQMDTAR